MELLKTYEEITEFLNLKEIAFTVKYFTRWIEANDSEYKNALWNPNGHSQSFKQIFIRMTHNAWADPGKSEIIKINQYRFMLSNIDITGWNRVKDKETEEWLDNMVDFYINFEINHVPATID